MNLGGWGTPFSPVQTVFLDCCVLGGLRLCCGIQVVDRVNYKESGEKTGDRSSDRSSETGWVEVEKFTVTSSEMKCKLFCSQGPKGSRFRNGEGGFRSFFLSHFSVIP